MFLDIIMPDLDGIETLIWSRQKYPELKVIIMTGMNQEEIWKKAMLSVSTDFITKPFSYEQLRGNLNLYLPLESENNGG